MIPQLGTGGVNFQFNQMMGNRGIWPAYIRQDPIVDYCR